MSTPNYPQIEMGKYFKNRQKVFLINVSENRDEEQFESLSGIIVGHNEECLSARIPYQTGYDTTFDQSRKTTFKLTTETLGIGIQALVELIKVEPGNIFHLRLLSNLEMYQRRQVPRIDTTVKLYQFQRDISLDGYRRELTRIRSQLESNGVPANLHMMETAVNLGIGGIGFGCDAKTEPAPLSLFILGMNGETPVCALGDLVWQRFDKEKKMCGYRFIHISKADQNRLKGHILNLRRKHKIVVPLPKSNWELLDRMVYNGTHGRL